jgi:hypothetical protein
VFSRVEAIAYNLRAWRGVGLDLRRLDTGEFLAHGLDDTPRYEAAKEGEYRDPSMILDEQAAQVLANSLWDAGIRPEGARASVGQLAATQAHLEDMRAMAFQGLKVQKPGGGK